MKNIRIHILTVALFFLCMQTLKLKAQCPTDVLYGVNVVKNPAFANGYANWTYTSDPSRVNGYNAYGGGYSVPGDIYAGSSADYFNPGGFDDFPDHTATSDNMMLMVDGICKPDIKLWQQSVNVVSGKNYYFSVWIHTLKDFNVSDVLATLRFDINNVNLGGINAPRLLSDGWIQFETVWTSTLTGAVNISIENTTITECDTKIDFAIDDIAFIEGCGYKSLTPQPNLGVDQSICGTGGSITLNSGITQASDINITWYDGTGGLNTPGTKTISAPGTYYVCVTKTGSCTKMDTVVITNTFTPATSPNANLCTTGSTVLDAVFTGIGTTYQWKRNGVNLPAPSSNRTYTATLDGTYTVDVFSPGCGTVTSGNTVISTNSTITPIDAYYCANTGSSVPVTLGASGSNNTNYKWYTSSTGGSSINTGASYGISIPDGTITTQTYYVQDETVNTGTVGPNAEFTSGSAADIYPGNAINTSNNQYGIYFSPTQDFKLNSVQIPIRVSNGNPGTPMVVNSVTLRVYLDNSPSNRANETATSLVFTSTNPPVTIVGGGSNVATYSLYTFSFTNFNIPLSLGSNLVLKMDAINTNYELWRYQIGNRTSLTNPFSYVSTINPNPVSITNSLTNNSKSTTDYFGLYNWNISAQTPCSRIPVRAISNCPLPVTWAYFDAKNDAKQVILNWNTLNEEHNATFVVLRSVDGIHWDEIGRLDGQLNSTDAKNYTYYDKHPLDGISYYKIRQIDTDQQFSETAIEAVNRASAYSLNVYPNPFENTTNVLLVSTDVESISYVVYNDLGVAVESGKLTNNQSHKIGEQLKAGFYTLCTPTEKIKLIKY